MAYTWDYADRADQCQVSLDLGPALSRLQVERLLFLMQEQMEQEIANGINCRDITMLA